jgi:DNA excision repair protein ERCC-4
MNDEGSQHSDPTNSDDPIVPTGMLPEYLSQAFGELYAEDGLLVLGKGLGCLQLLASFVRFYADTEDGHLACVEEEKDETRKREGQQLKPPLVLVLGLRDSERNALVTILESWGTPPELLPTMITNESGQGKDREILYRRGGVFCITSRILIVDLLTNVASANSIDGILVAHAEQVTEESMEAFILRIFMGQKQPFGSGFVKAFTDAPDSARTASLSLSANTMRAADDEAAFDTANTPYHQSMTHTFIGGDGAHGRRCHCDRVCIVLTRRPLPPPIRPTTSA